MRSSLKRPLLRARESHERKLVPFLRSRLFRLARPRTQGTFCVQCHEQLLQLDAQDGAKMEKLVVTHENLAGFDLRQPGAGTVPLGLLQLNS